MLQRRTSPVAFTMLPHAMTPSDTPIRLLLVEDDERLARLTSKFLEANGVVVTHAADGERALQLLHQQGEVALERRLEVVLLDLLLPGASGIDVCREVRLNSDVPIIMVTALDEEDDRVVGLDAGADDYLPKPFAARELLARVRAQVRRARGNAGPSIGSAVRKVGRLHLDSEAMTVKLGDVTVPVTAYEFALLTALAERPGRVLSREKLLELAKGSAEEAFDRSIDVRISRLRQKLGDDPRQPRLLKTVRGAGYVLALDEEAR